MAGGSKFRSAISWLGLVDDDRFEEQAPAEKPPADVPVPTVTPIQMPNNGYVGDNNTTVLLTTGIVLAPATYTEIQPVADRYRAGLPTILDLRVMSIADAQSSAGFFSGMLYALNGSMRRVAKGVFLLEPLGVALDAAALDQALAGLR